MSDPLRTKAEVLGVLKLGGFVMTDAHARYGYGLACLYDQTGKRVEAWQNAIKANIGPSRCGAERCGESIRWRLK